MASMRTTRSKAKSGIAAFEQAAAAGGGGAAEDLAKPTRMERSRSYPEDTRLAVKSFSKPDKTFQLSRMVEGYRNNLGTAKGMRVVMQPGATWQKCHATGGAEDKKSCQARHVGMVDSGSFTIKCDDGVEKTITAGDSYVIMPGHAYSVNGETPLVLYEFESVLDDVVVPQPEASDTEAFDGVLLHHEPNVVAKPLSAPDQQTSAKDSMFVTNVNLFESAKVSKITGKPGASWLQHVKPTLDTHTNCEHASCTRRHVGFVKSGRLQVKMDYGDQMTIGPEDSFVIEPGHIADVVGDVDMVMYEFTTGL